MLDSIYNFDSGEIGPPVADEEQGERIPNIGECNYCGDTEILNDTGKCVDCADWAEREDDDEPEFDHD